MRAHVEGVRSNTIKTSRPVNVEGIKEDQALEADMTTKRALKSENLSISQDI